MIKITGSFLAALSIAALNIGCKSSRSTTVQTPLEQFKSLVTRITNLPTKHQVREAANPHLDHFWDTMRTFTKEDEDFKQRMINERREKRKAYNEGRKWGANFYSLSNVEYDVNKTDSLVSPFVGNIIFDHNTDSKTFIEKTQAESSEVRSLCDYHYTIKYRADYAFQEGRWVNTKLRYKDLKHDTDWKINSSSLTDHWPELDKALGL